mgnify:CR=1 FL=1
MREADIRSKCRITSNRDRDTFVGLKCDDGDISVNFPIGYHLSENNKELRKDILLLLTVLAENTERKDSELPGPGRRFEEVEFPMQSYLYLIKDFFARGYYREQESSYKTARTGKICWSRTIKSQQPYVQDRDVFYLDFVTKKNSKKENELITLIHEYCVYESFDRMGWLFTTVQPKKPRISKREKVFRAVLREKISHTFQDRNRMLFRHMLAIVDYEGDRDSDRNYHYGTYRFEYIWEALINKVFGIEKKRDYYPGTTWQVNGVKYNNEPLKPDTIMLCGNNVYILDAKYYKYGVTGRLCDLPGSESVNKQITYGEYVAYAHKFKEKHGSDMKVYNAFLMPFDSWKNNDADNLEMIKIGEAGSSWKDDSEEYHRIKGILVDIRTLMKLNARQDLKAIEKLAELIVS